MGDRTSVSLIVLEVHAEQLKPIFENYYYPEDEHKPINGLVGYTFHDINYADLEFEDELKALGIAFNKTWAAGNDYSAGRENLRFTAEGIAQHLEVNQEDEGMPLETLLLHLDNHEALKGAILAYQSQVTPLPWTYQDEYGKRYRARQLIAPKTG